MKLPEIYKNTLNEKIDNNKFFCYANHIETDFNSLPAIFSIKTKNQDYQLKIIGKTLNYLISDEGIIIKLADIISIKKDE